jgi:hypothetical protein
MEWKEDTSDKNPEQWDSYVVASNVSSCVASKLIYICYFDFNIYWYMIRDCDIHLFKCFSIMAIFYGAHSI